MNKKQIEQRFKGEKRFLGVFAADQIPHYIPIGTGAVINLDPSYKLGSHWVGIYKSGNLEYFDPLGKAPPSHLKLSSPILFNRRKVQDPDSISCGEFAIHFVKRRLKGDSFSSIQHLWTRNKIFNDLLL